MRVRALVLLVTGLLLLGGAVIAAPRALRATSASPSPVPQARAVAAPQLASSTPTKAASPVASGSPVPSVAPPGTPAAAAAPEAPPAPGPAPTTPPLSPSPAPLTGLAVQARLDALLADPAVPPAGQLAVAVLDGQGREVYALRAEQPLLPASTEKLVVAAGALAVFGPDHRFATTVTGTAPLAPDGTLTGDLVVLGGGDPVLASPIFAAEVEPDRPHTPLVALADQLAAAGVRRVTGQLLGDATAFADEPLPSGWLDRYLPRLDGTRTSALTVDGGRALGIEDGRLIATAAVDPALQTVVQLSLLLNERGIGVDGGLAVTWTPPPAAVVLARVESPPLRELLAVMVARSDNGIADQVFRSIGAASGEPTWAGAAAGTQLALGGLGLDWTGAVLADGSGLSRDDRLSAGFLGRLDQVMSASTAGAEWEALMAVAGRSGTLRRRLTGTLAEGRLRGKTGTLSDVRALVGAVTGPQGARYHVAVIGNQLSDEGLGAVRNLTDEIVLALTEDLYGCIRIPALPSPPADALPPTAGAPSSEVPAPASPGAAEGVPEPPEAAYELQCAAA